MTCLGNLERTWGRGGGGGGGGGRDTEPGNLKITENILILLKGTALYFQER